MTYTYERPDGECYECEEPVTQVVKYGDTLYEPIIGLWAKETGGSIYAHPDVYLTTDPRWSGYSEYTITSTWDEFHLKVDTWERHYHETGKFFVDLAAGADYLNGRRV